MTTCRKVMEKYLPFVRLSDNETWVELRHGSISEEGFSSPGECNEWITRMYSDWVRPDVFHGLQPIQIVRVR